MNVSGKGVEWTKLKYIIADLLAPNVRVYPHYIIYVNNSNCFESFN